MVIISMWVKNKNPVGGFYMETVNLSCIRIQRIVFLCASRGHNLDIFLLPYFFVLFIFDKATFSGNAKNLFHLPTGHK